MSDSSWQHAVLREIGVSQRGFQVLEAASTGPVRGARDAGTPPRPAAERAAAPPAEAPAEVPAVTPVATPGEVSGEASAATSASAIPDVSDPQVTATPSTTWDYAPVHPSFEDASAEREQPPAAATPTPQAPAPEAFASDTPAPDVPDWGPPQADEAQGVPQEPEVQAPAVPNPMTRPPAVAGWGPPEPPDAPVQPPATQQDFPQPDLAPQPPAPQISAHPDLVPQAPAPSESAPQAPAPSGFAPQAPAQPDSAPHPLAPQNHAQPDPAPQAPAQHDSAQQPPAHQAPAQQAPAQQDFAQHDFSPQVPAPQVPAPQAPAQHDFAPQAPAPEVPAQQDFPQQDVAQPDLAPQPSAQPGVAQQGAAQPAPQEPAQEAAQPVNPLITSDFDWEAAVNPVLGSVPTAAASRPAVEGEERRGPEAGTAPPASASAPGQPDAIPADQLVRKDQHGDPLARRMGRGVRKAVGGGGREARELAEFADLMRRPVPSTRQIAIASVRGGAGKTTMAALVATELARHRADRVLAADADAELGSLPLRLGVRAELSLFDLVAQRPRTFEEAARFLPRTAEGLLVLSSTRGGRIAGEFTLDTFQDALGLVGRYVAATVVDCGAGILTELNRGVIAQSHGLVLVTPGTVDGALSARGALEWFAANGQRALLPRTVIAMVSHAPQVGADLVRAGEMLTAWGLPVVAVPYDRHLATGGSVHPARVSAAARAAVTRLVRETFARSVAGVAG